MWFVFLTRSPDRKHHRLVDTDDVSNAAQELAIFNSRPIMGLREPLNSVVKGGISFWLPFFVLNALFREHAR